jgi:hypothetical protein
LAKGFAGLGVKPVVGALDAITHAGDRLGLGLGLGLGHIVIIIIIIIIIAVLNVITITNP